MHDGPSDLFRCRLIMSATFLDAMVARSRDENDGPAPAKETCLFGENRLTHEKMIIRPAGAGAGRGWFAVDSLEPGTVLWTEMPLTFAATRQGLVRKVDKTLWRHENLCRKPAAESRGEGIVASNFFDFGNMGSYIFEQTSLLNHSCCPNASVRVVFGETVASETRASVTVVRRVETDQELHISYSGKILFLPTRARRVQIMDRWGFCCRCDRCEGTLPQPELERWALLEEAAAAADAIGRKPTAARQAADPAHMALVTRAASLVAEWMPSLAEGERFAEHIEYYAELAAAPDQD